MPVILVLIMCAIIHAKSQNLLYPLAYAKIPRTKTVYFLSQPLQFFICMLNDLFQLFCSTFICKRNLCDEETEQSAGYLTGSIWRKCGGRLCGSWHSVTSAACSLVYSCVCTRLNRIISKWMHAACFLQRAYIKKSGLLFCVTQDL